MIAWSGSSRETAVRKGRRDPGRRTDFIESDHAVVAVESGVFDALSHYR